MLAGLYVVRCYISCLPRLCSVLLHGEKKHKKWFMNINEQAGIPNLNRKLIVPPFTMFNQRMSACGLIEYGAN